MLGDEALACLKDLKKWLKLYDEKTGRLDVARCLAEANFVRGDVLEILASWSESASDDRLKSKIALACVELLVPLTWPIEKDDDQMTVNHHRHIPYLQQAQRVYKRAILEHHSGSILRAAVRTALPSIALALDERTSRDEGIIKLLLYFFRNIALIASSSDKSCEGEENQLVRSSTIEAFHRQDVFALLLTISSNIGEDFNTQDTVLVEILFHILKGIDVEALFMDKTQLNAKNNDELKGLLSKEANMHRSYLRTAPSRHNRFGTMIWVKRDGDGRYSTVSGQDSIKNEQQTLSKMDQSKRWNKPKQRSKNDEPTNDRFDMPATLTESARQQLRLFVEEFLDSGFNPLFNHVRRAIEREADRVLESHKQQYFYVVSWFLEAERVRRGRKKNIDKTKEDTSINQSLEPDSFGLVASVLIQEFFVMLNRFMQETLDVKSWRELQAGIRCFTQILLVVQDMAGSSIEEDQEIAENIQNRIFYEETTHDRIAAILRSYQDQGFGYLDACTGFVHTFLRLLERYSRENVDMQVRSKRKARKKKDNAVKGKDDAVGEDEASEMEDVREAERICRERKFDFNRFVSKFTNQACIDTFLAFVKFYNDLNREQLKRAHRFFHRIAFKQDLSVMLLRLDILLLFQKIVKGPEGLDSKNPVFQEWEDLVRHIIRKLSKKHEQRPELAIELLFSKIPATVFYLEYGYEKQTVQSKPRAPTPLEVKGSMTDAEQIGVVVAVLHDEHMEYLQWMVKTLSDAVDERQSWAAEATAREADEGQEHSNPAVKDTNPEAPSIVVNTPSEGIRIALFKNARLRLLMTLSGFKRIGDEDEPQATWMIPSNLTSENLRSTRDLIEKHRMDPTFYYGDDEPVMAEDLLRRKSSEKPKRAEYDDDSDGSDSMGDEEILFPAGGPSKTMESREAILEKLKKKRRRRRSSKGEVDSETLEARRTARAQADLERRRGIKSTEFIHDSDEESDEERDRDFFAKEDARRLGQQKKVLEDLSAGQMVLGGIGSELRNSMPPAKRKAGFPSRSSGRKKRRASSNASSVDQSARSAVESLPPTPSVRATSVSNLETDESEETPLSSPPPLGLGKRSSYMNQSVAATKTSSHAEDIDGTSSPAIDESTEPLVKEQLDSTAARRRPRITVFDDSDDG